MHPFSFSSMATFEQTLEGVSNLLRCPLCENELQSTFTVKECGHHFCQKCIYPELGTSCKCPTCSIPARVGNLLRNPSYDILVACTTKLRALYLAQTREGTPELPRGMDEVSGTPIGSIVWTYDCGPTFPNSGPLSSWSSNTEMQTFPSLNTAMASHGRDRAVRLRDVTLTPPRQTSEERDHGNGDENAAQKSTPEQSRATPPAPTISQLQRLLDIRNENSIMAGSQEKTTRADTFSLANESSESSDDGVRFTI
ncbi:hypothetical protein EDD21DRAFT_195356 [Dissophora ornata]|nr:hypothetical protein EDD21DRAFT_195356 [Dissophora ornata]